jgi:hypothetical protein
MAVSYDNSAKGSGADSDNITWSHTVGSGSNRVLIVRVECETGHPSGVAYNGVAMTSIYSATRFAISHSVWALVNPASGAHNVVVSFEDARSGSAISNSYAGALQSSNPAATGATGTGTTATATRTVGSNGSMGQFNVQTDGLASSTPGSGQTETQETSYSKLSTSYKAVDAGSNSLTATWTGSDIWQCEFVEIAPLVSTPLPVFMHDYRQRRNP